MRPALLAVAALALAAAPAHAERVTVGVSTDTIPISSNFAGTTLALFGVIEPDAGNVTPRANYDAVVTVRGPARTQVVRRRERLAVIWVNGQSRTYLAAPIYYAALANREIDDIAPAQLRAEMQLGLASLRLTQRAHSSDDSLDRTFRDAFLSARQGEGLYTETEGGEQLRFLVPNVFRARIPLPSNVPTGFYTIDVMVLADGAVVGRETTGFTIEKTGFEQAVFEASRDTPTLYGIISVVFAIATGWAAGVLFRRN